MTLTVLRKTPFTSLNTNMVTCDSVQTLASPTRAHFYIGKCPCVPCMYAPVPQVFTLIPRKCARQAGKRWEGLQRGGLEDEALVLWT